jgi:hypothetical protein
MIAKRGILYTVAVVMAAVAFMAPAASAEPPSQVRTQVTTQAGVVADCGQTFDRYSDGRWTYTKARFCLRTDTNDVWPVLEFSECQYYWGLAWYNANSKYQCHFDFHYKVTRNNHVLLKDSSSGSDGNSGEIQGTSARCSGTGAYTLEAQYVLTGPFWDDTKTNSGHRTYNLFLPCH